MCQLCHHMLYMHERNSKAWTIDSRNFPQTNKMHKSPFQKSRKGGKDVYATSEHQQKPAVEFTFESNS